MFLDVTKKVLQYDFIIPTNIITLPGKDIVPNLRRDQEGSRRIIIFKKEKGGGCPPTLKNRKMN
jgi:hypothetical protein